MITAIILRFLHYVIALSVFMHDLIFSIPNLYGMVYSKKNLVASIRSDAKLLKKLPMHVGLVMVENNFSYRDIANIIVWSVAMGISYVSVYDINGEIKRNSILLQQQIERSKEETFASEESKFEISLSVSNNKKNAANNEEGSSSKQARVHLVAADDGRENLVKATHSFCELVNNNQYLIEDIVPSSVDSHIQKIFQLPDPDLVILVGHIDSLLGYLPWQIRLSEILKLPSHKGVNYKAFLSVMNIYGKTEQRFGK
ncbi:hypothetical protein SNE40_005653 [Patella caerulea]|uniref:ditrans,polycis-polyprenyl diphosphate synthase [(2E,6E)-farnesyldiphosphate specific] n=1 Tax=Patella caerulea TaxID=87958 RepID=A0AAN8PWR8_PATCE